MFKKLSALLMSLLICLSLVPGQVRATGTLAFDDPPAQVEPLDPDAPDEPEPPAPSASVQNVPEKDEGPSLD